jgi:hypothetical protein
MYYSYLLYPDIITEYNDMIFDAKQLAKVNSCSFEILGK